MKKCFFDTTYIVMCLVYLNLYLLPHCVDSSSVIMSSYIWLNGIFFGNFSQIIYDLTFFHDVTQCTRIQDSINPIQLTPFKHSLQNILYINVYLVDYNQNSCIYIIIIIACFKRVKIVPIYLLEPLLSCWRSLGAHLQYLSMSLSTQRHVLSTQEVRQ